MADNEESFYRIEESGKVIITPSMYADFFIKHNFVRIDKEDDRIYLLHNVNNVVRFFNHKTDMVCFLEEQIKESDKKNHDAVRNKIANDNSTLIQKSFALIPSIKLEYYSDKRNSFGLPFKNGFFLLEKDCGKGLQRMEYSDVKGFFSPHKIQERLFYYTEKIGMFEKFLMSASTGKNGNLTEEDENTFLAFCSMFGYLCHNYKDKVNNPCIVLTDLNADGASRNGGRGKSLLINALKEVTEVMIKGGLEFDPTYTFVFADLEKSCRIYTIDDIPANFKFEALYTNILGDISCQRKGSKAEIISFNESPKFTVTSNWVIPYDEKNASTNRRFAEYKFTDYYNITRSPKDDFGQIFFDDWDNEEWNRFYSFVFRCVELFLDKGLIKIEYDKEQDNFKSCFENDAVLEEFERIITLLTDTTTEITSALFLREYKSLTNPLRNEDYFHTKNVFNMIDSFFKHHATNPVYANWIYRTSQNRKKWVKCKK